MHEILARLGARRCEATHFLRAVFQRFSPSVRAETHDAGFARFMREYEAKNKGGEAAENFNRRMRFVH